MSAIEYQILSSGLDRDYDILCLDTEFTRLPFDKEAVWSWAQQARMLSIALASLNEGPSQSRLYVARNIDLAIRRLCTPFVLSDVLPRIPAATTNSTARHDEDFSQALNGFIRQRQSVTGLPPLLAVDWIGDAYLVNTMLDLPCEWLLLDSVPEIEHALGLGFPPEAARHNALHDALAIRDGLRLWFNRGS